MKVCGKRQRPLFRRLSLPPLADPVTMIGHTALFVAVVATVACSEENENFDYTRLVEEKGPSARHEKCCLPEKVSSYMIELKSLNAATPSVLAVQIDYDRKQQVMLNYTGSFETPQNKILIDYEKQMVYAVLPKYPEYCYKTPVKLPLIRCISDDAEYLGSSYLGPLGAGQLPYDGWRMKYNVRGLDIVITLAMTKEGCVPLVEGVAYPQDPSRNQLYMFSGYRPGLTNSSAFHLPDSCFKE